MKQIVWLGSLLVVPLGACLFWLGHGSQHSKSEVTGINADPAEQESLSDERGTVKNEAPPAAGLEPDVRDTLHRNPVELGVPPVLDDGGDEESDPAEHSRRVRLPVILAIRGSHPTPEARRGAILEALRNSGECNEAWTNQWATVLDGWTDGLSTGVELHPIWTSARCFQAGCEVEMSFPDRASYERASKEFRSLQEPGATHGGRVQTPAVEGDDGQVLASWIMLRPDESRS